MASYHALMFPEDENNLYNSPMLVKNEQNCSPASPTSQTSNEEEFGGPNVMLSLDIVVGKIKYLRDKIKENDQAKDALWAEFENRFRDLREKQVSLVTSSDTLREAYSDLMMSRPVSQESKIAVRDVTDDGDGEEVGNSNELMKDEFIQAADENNVTLELKHRRRQPPVARNHYIEGVSQPHCPRFVHPTKSGLRLPNKKRSSRTQHPASMGSASSNAQYVPESVVNSFQAGEESARNRLKSTNEAKSHKHSRIGFPQMPLTSLAHENIYAKVADSSPGDHSIFQDPVSKRRCQHILSTDRQNNESGNGAGAESAAAVPVTESARGLAGDGKCFSPSAGQDPGSPLDGCGRPVG